MSGKLHVLDLVEVNPMLPIDILDEIYDIFRRVKRGEAMFTRDENSHFHHYGTEEERLAIEAEIAARVEDYKKQNEELKNRNRDQFDKYNQNCIHYLEKIKNLQELSRHQQHHTEALDKNWATHHDATLNCIRKALEFGEDASIPQMVAKIEYLVARDHINDSLEALRKNAMSDEEIEELMR